MASTTRIGDGFQKDIFGIVKFPSFFLSEIWKHLISIYNVQRRIEHLNAFDKIKKMLVKSIKMLESQLSLASKLMQLLKWQELFYLRNNNCNS